MRANIYKEVTERYFVGHTLFGDTALRAILISIGAFVLVPEVVSVYRITGAGVWSSLDNEAKLSLEYEGAKRLSSILPNFHGRYQRDRLYVYARALALIKFRDGKYFDSAKWGARAVARGICKIRNYVSRKFG